MASPQQPVSFPHLSPYAPIGGYPDVKHDVPPSAVFMFLFILGAIFHMTTFQINNRRGHKFVISGATFGFCMSRLVTLSLRIAWACHPHNVSLAIASQIFNSAGVVLLFVIMFIFSGRILRSLHPRLEWSKPLGIASKLWTGSLVAALIVIVITTVMSFYTINPYKQVQFTDARKFGTIYFAIYAFSPVLQIIVAFLMPKVQDAVPFGKRGNLKEQVLIVLFCSFWLTFGAAFRAGAGFFPHLIAKPAWFQDRGAFYLVYFTIEITVVYTLAICRADQRFHIPNKPDRIAAKDGRKTESDAERGQAQADAETEKENEQDNVDARNVD